MTIIYLAVGAVVSLIGCLVYACRIAFRSDPALPPASARALRKQQKALRAKLPRWRVPRP